MNLKKVFLIIFSISLILFICIGLIKINIINTRALSPLGNTNDNYEMVKEEFGEDFSNFIKDNSPVKIYANNSEEALAKIGDNEFKIKNESDLLKGGKYIFTKIGDFFVGIKDKVDEITNNINNK